MILPDDFELRIAARATACGVELSPDALRALAEHARSVVRESDELHLTAIEDPEEFLERHLGESFEGAALIGPESEGTLLDLGSGQGYPALPIAMARPRLSVLLAEASSRKARFLRQTLHDLANPRIEVLEVQVQRPADIVDLPPLDWITSRAMGGWTKILPRLVPCLAPEGQILIWAGADVEKIAHRVVWRRLALVDQRPLPGREQSWIWRFRRA